MTNRIFTIYTHDHRDKHLVCDKCKSRISQHYYTDNLHIYCRKCKSHVINEIKKDIKETNIHLDFLKTQLNEFEDDRHRNKKSKYQMMND